MTPKTAILACTLAAAASLAATASSPAAGESASVYTKIDVENACVDLESDEMGATWSCPGHGGYGVLLSEGDLRQSVFFGYVGEWYAGTAFESFGQFNHVNDTVEWRVRDNVPYATILRWFIENANPDTATPDDAHRGQVLVVSKVGQPGVGDACIVAYVDALANKDANTLARQIADTEAEGFTCRTATPDWRGARGPLSGEPSRGFD